jgi:hypothetical protein
MRFLAAWGRYEGDRHRKRKAAEEMIVRHSPCVCRFVNLGV